jgi:23S rRNA (cytosine1962-C5)-methyltransferase
VVKSCPRLRLRGQAGFPAAGHLPEGAPLCYTAAMDSAGATVKLKPGKDKPLRRRHPWVFSGAVSRVEGSFDDGDLVRVADHQGEYLATGYVNRRSQIRVRLLSWDAAERIDADFWRRRLQRAFAGRRDLAADPQTDAYRLVYGEADGLPGLIVDRYGDWLAVQCLTLGMARRQAELVGLLADPATYEGLGHRCPTGIWGRNDADVRLKEGLPLESGLLWGEAPPDRVPIVEQGHAFWVDLKGGQKTGFYLDQRANRRRAAAYCAGAEVLNAFAYTGAFGVYAGRAGARSVVHVDTSAEALDLAAANLELNGCQPQERVVGDVFRVLRRYREEGRRFDVAMLDPPKFAASQAQVLPATRGYKDANLLAMQLLRPGGVLITFSCSGLVSADLFQKVLFGASLDAGREVQVLEQLGQGADHPLLLTFPESAYLKGFVCRVW